MLVKPATAVEVKAASVPPAKTTSQRPEVIKRAALAMACVPAAQAVHEFSAGPWKPWRIETAAGAALGIIIGTKKGETRRAPLSRSTFISASRVSIPPMPVPMKTPERDGSAVRVPV
jgi:hypothetical protein